MRRGIARFHWLSALALATWAAVVLFHGFGGPGGRRKVLPPAAPVLGTTAAVFSADGQRLMTQDAYGAFRLWDAATGRAVPITQLRGLVLAPQDLHGATLTDCRLVGDWRGRDLRGARLWECDLSG